MGRYDIRLTGFLELILYATMNNFYRNYAYHRCSENTTNYFISNEITWGGHRAYIVDTDYPIIRCDFSEHLYIFLFYELNEIF